MTKEIALMEDRAIVAEQTSDFSTFEVAGQLLGIAILDVQDVLNPMKIAKIPLAGPEVAGLLNLRGRIVTAIDMRQRLGLPAFENRDNCMSIVIEKNGELYSLIVDKVGDVLSLPDSQFEQTPANLKQVWSAVSSGVYRLEKRIMVVIDVNNLLEYSKSEF